MSQYSAETWEMWWISINKFDFNKIEDEDCDLDELNELRIE